MRVVYWIFAGVLAALAGLFALGNRSDVTVDFWPLGPAFEMPIFAAQKQDRTLQSKLALLERVREQGADHLQQLRADLDAAYVDWTVAGERLRNMEAAILPDAAARAATLLAQHGAGTGPLSAVLEARRALAETRLQELALRAGRAKARIALQYFEPMEDHR